MFWHQLAGGRGDAQEDEEVMEAFTHRLTSAMGFTTAIASLKGINFNCKGGLPSLPNASNTSALPVEGEIRNSISGFSCSEAGL